MTLPPPIQLPVSLEVVIRLLAGLQGISEVELLKRLIKDEVARTKGGMDSYVKEKLDRFQGHPGEEPTCGPGQAVP